MINTKLCQRALKTLLSTVMVISLGTIFDMFTWKTSRKL